MSEQHIGPLLVSEKHTEPPSGVSPSTPQHSQAPTCQSVGGNYQAKHTGAPQPWDMGNILTCSALARDLAVCSPVLALLPVLTWAPTLVPTTAPSLLPALELALSLASAGANAGAILHGAQWGFCFGLVEKHGTLPTVDV